MFSSTNRWGTPVSNAIRYSLDIIKPSGIHPQYLIPRPGCTAQSRPLSDALACYHWNQHYQIPNMLWKGGGMLPFSRKTHYENTMETQDCDKDKNKSKIQRREQRINIKPWSKRQQAHQRHPRFQGPWQQKQQYQKVRNSFLQDRKRGIQGGNINWERCGVIVVVDTTKTDNARCLNRGFL